VALVEEKRGARMFSQGQERERKRMRHQKKERKGIDRGKPFHYGDLQRSGEVDCPL